MIQKGSPDPVHIGFFDPNATMAESTNIPDLFEE
jgi:hypothetical protein